MKKTALKLLIGLVLVAFVALTGLVSRPEKCIESAWIINPTKKDLHLVVIVTKKVKNIGNDYEFVQLDIPSGEAQQVSLTRQRNTRYGFNFYVGRDYSPAKKDFSCSSFNLSCEQPEFELYHNANIGRYDLRFTRHRGKK